MRVGYRIGGGDWRGGLEMFGLVVLRLAFVVWPPRCQERTSTGCHSAGGSRRVTRPLGLPFLSSFPSCPCLSPPPSLLLFLFSLFLPLPPSSSPYIPSPPPPVRNVLVHKLRVRLPPRLPQPLRLPLSRRPLHSLRIHPARPPSVRLPRPSLSRMCRLPLPPMVNHLGMCGWNMDQLLTRQVRLCGRCA